MTTPVFAEYEAKRPQLRTFVAQHYIREFDLRPGTMLDAACGDGFWSGLFAERGWDVVGVDHDPEYLAWAREKNPDIPFLEGDVTSPMPLGQYDLVLARGLPMFYQPTLDAAPALVRNLFRHVRGLLLVSVYSDGSGQDFPMLMGGTARYHRDEDILAAVEAGGARIVHTARDGKYLQVGATR